MIFSIVGQLLLGWLAADVFTGVFHWWEDNFGNEKWPILGAWLIAPQQLHHIDPLAFTRHGFWARNGASIIASILAGAGLAAIFGPSFFILALIVGTALSNEVHRFAHQPSQASKPIRVLQEIGILQSARGHAKHHRPPYQANYCVLTDWTNAVINAFRGLPSS